ncbi:ABC transporter substrate-binding protein [Halomonas sp. FME1]|uniref:ABC transporter substrate-binding protein n=1 Tax=Halomonas casei TaxID=2742613 RepID=A0ABR9F3Y9_9GAMM|nr:ProQ/FINO family protein [Halomonas casei]MBE0401204.1 ABC transporter substrate-binding protein [Halomonas casei]
MAASLITMLDDLEQRLESTQAELQALREENQRLKQLVGNNALPQGEPSAATSQNSPAAEAVAATEASAIIEETEEVENPAEASSNDPSEERVSSAGLDEAQKNESLSLQPAAVTPQAPSPHALLNEWYERYPKAFFKGHTKPLKVGIHQDLAEREAWPSKLVRRALANYVNLPRYIKAVRAGAERVDLDGQPAGNVDKQAALHASEKRGEPQAARSKDGTSKEGASKVSKPQKQAQAKKPSPAAEESRQNVAKQPDMEKNESRSSLSMEDKLLGLQQKFKGG